MRLKKLNYLTAGTFKESGVAVIAPSGTSIGSSVVAMPTCWTCSTAARASVANENSMLKVKSTEIMT